ncbi:MAG TPA: amino acid permease [Gaiellaceae bacterium]|nr:amino acid permease [Gaiellaceae bacterium]
MADYSAHEKDRRMLHALGYAQELRRGMSGFSNFAISFTIISILSGTLTLYATGINYGGAVEEAWGWPIVSVFVVIVGLGMAEIASKYPTAGGLYYWASKMGGPAWGWFTGWFNLIGQIAITAGIDYGAAIFTDALLNLLWPGTFHSSPHEVIYVYACILGLHALMNIFSVRLVALLNDISVWWHVLGVLIIVGFLAFKPDHHQSVGTVFSKTINNSGFSHQWLWFVLLLGLLQAQYTFTGYDASAHMSEETQDAGRAAARGVVMSIVVSAVFGYILALGVTFAIQSFQSTTGAGLFAVKQVFLDALGLRAAEFLLFIIVGAQLYCGMSSITSASRMLYAFSRDGATPGHRIWRRLNAARVPYMAVLAIAVLAFLCAFPAYFSKGIGVGAGYVAYAAVTSIATIGLYIAYALPIFLRLRLGDAWEPGEWNLGKHYKWIGVIACVWVVFIALLFMAPLSPAGVPWNSSFTWLSFNYAPIAVLGTLLIVGGWWMLSANKWFKGPIAQGTEEELARIETQYEHGTPGPAPSSA